ncbi:MAG: alkaline phosphatase D family protein [Solirubrobacterales bacterium]
MAELVLGPLLRHVGERDATVWVEVDEACEVEVLGHTEPTFCVDGHHYALVCITGLEPGTQTEYEVSLDGERRWPVAESGFPASQIRTLDPERPLRVSFGSCRVALPMRAPYVFTKDENGDGAEVDALHVYAHELMRDSDNRWPDLFLLLGDQIYVDEGSPATREFIRSRRDVSEPPGTEVVDFEEYTRLHWESWSEPYVRWLFSTVPTAMVIDDHDISDDWNISRSWKEEMDAKAWWHRRVEAGFMTYWIYQHVGNLSPDALAEDETYARVRESRDDAGSVLRDYARRAYENREGIRWSYRRDLCDTRVIVMDSRGGRVLEEGRRSIFDDEERDWVWEQAEGDFDHLLIATSDPFLLSHALHDLEAWSEAVCDGAWGGPAARLTEKLRRAEDFDHWASFGRSFRSLSRLLRDVGASKERTPPASIVVLAGDVHHAYLAEVGFPAGSGVQSHVYQAVCSPFRNPLDKRERRVIRALFRKGAAKLTRGLARAAGVEPPEIGWRFLDGPYFDNQVASLTLDGRSAQIKLEKTRPGEAEERSLETSFERRLA